MAVEIANSRLWVGTSLQEHVTKVLEAIVVDRERAAAEFRPHIEQLSSEIVAVPRFRLGRGQLHIEHTLVGASEAALLNYGLALLMTGWPDNGKLCRCELEATQDTPACGKFFVAYKRPGPGQVRGKYCSKEHADAAHKAGNAERLRNSRENRKKLAANRSPRRSK